MGLPTLLLPGFTTPPKNATNKEKERIKGMTGSEYLMGFLSDRIQIAPGAAPKIKPKKPGDKVLVISAGTGSGKSTVIPPYLYERFNVRFRGNIAVTQPRVLNAKTIAEGTPENYSFMKLDINLGYSTGEFKRLPSEKGVIYMTIGILLAEINNKTYEEIIKKYKFIIVDEVHDRSVDVDLVLFHIKKLLEEFYDDPRCPFILLMSATFNHKIFMDYFDCPENNFMEFKGSTFPIQENFPKYDVPNYINYAVNLAEKLHIENISDIEAKSNFRDILIFVQGSNITKKVIEKLHYFNSQILSKSLSEVKNYIKNLYNLDIIGGNDKNYYIAPIQLSTKTFNYGGTEYQNLFSPIDNIMVPLYKVNDKGGVEPNNIIKWVKPTRRIIISTNIAETGVTIETLKYCIDTGYVFSVNFNPDFGTTVMLGKNVTRGMAMQRRGRVGRKSPGNWYPCYTEKTFNDLPQDQFADILTNDITPHILNIIIKETDSQIVNKKDTSIDEYKKVKLFKTNYISDNDEYFIRHINPLNFSSIDLFEIPAANSLIYSLEKLYGLGFIDTQYNPTVLGLYSKGFSKISAESIKMIFSGFSYGSNILDLITIASILMVGSQEILTTKYKPINFLKPKVSDVDYEFYYKTIIADQFIEYLLIWESYSDFINKLMIDIRKKALKGKSYNFQIESIEEWCEMRGINYSGIIYVTKIRNEIIAGMISLGFNPYYNGLGLEKGKYSILQIMLNNLEDGIEEIKKLKKCILNGYRFNLVVWDDTSKRYILRHRNIPIQLGRNNLLSRMGEDAVQKNANFIIISGIKLGESMKNKGMYEFMASEPISIVDSLNIDIDFIKF